MQAGIGLPKTVLADTGFASAEPRRLAMLAKLETQDAKDLYARRKQTVEPAFAIIKTAIGFANPTDC